MVVAREHLAMHVDEQLALALAALVVRRVDLMPVRVVVVGIDVLAKERQARGIDRGPAYSALRHAVHGGRMALLERRRPDLRADRIVREEDQQGVLHERGRAAARLARRRFENVGDAIDVAVAGRDLAKPHGELGRHLDLRAIEGAERRPRRSFGRREGRLQERCDLRAQLRRTGHVTNVSEPAAPGNERQIGRTLIQLFTSGPLARPPALRTAAPSRRAAAARSAPTPRPRRAARTGVGAPAGSQCANGRSAAPGSRRKPGSPRFRTPQRRAPRGAARRRTRRGLAGATCRPRRWSSTRGRTRRRRTAAPRGRRRRRAARGTRAAQRGRPGDVVIRGVAAQAERAAADVDDPAAGGRAREGEEVLYGARGRAGRRPTRRAPASPASPWVEVLGRGAGQHRR